MEIMRRKNKKRQAGSQQCAVHNLINEYVVMYINILCFLYVRLVMSTVCRRTVYNANENDRPIRFDHYAPSIESKT